MVCLWLSIPNGIVYWNKYMFHSYTSVFFLYFPDKRLDEEIGLSLRVRLKRTPGSEERISLKILDSNHSSVKFGRNEQFCFKGFASFYSQKEYTISPCKRNPVYIALVYEAQV